VNLDVHPFKCGSCKSVTPQRLLKEYECSDIPEAPGTVWLTECQRCFEQRIVYPTERVISKEDDIERCLECGNWKMKSSKCRICLLADGVEKLKVKFFTGHSDQFKELDIADL